MGDASVACGRVTHAGGSRRRSGLRGEGDGDGGASMPEGGRQAPREWPGGYSRSTTSTTWSPL
ncbi:hypothetical protein [Falsiroseomonas stagni]|uniref:hypothetical protein n=1 Tax=Falsiroseomonas stagni TaxID=484882 RepID=UPI00158793E4|nr:hypothetical protein [Falsiroseomonas stagni]